MKKFTLIVFGLFMLLAGCQSTPDQDVAELYSCDDGTSRKNGEACPQVPGPLLCWDGSRVEDSKNCSAKPQ